MHSVIRSIVAPVTGIVAAVIGGAAALLPLYATFLPEQDADAERLVGILLYLSMLATLILVGMLAIAAARAAWNVDLKPALMTWSVCVLVIGVYFTLLFSALSDCELNYAFPVRAYEDACD